MAEMNILILYIVMVLQNVQSIFSEEIDPKRMALGCYVDNYINNERLLAAYRHDNDTMTPKMCIKICLDRRFLYAGVEYAKECFCGHHKPSVSLKASESECSSQCAGNILFKCGGYNRINVYETIMPRPLKHYYYWIDFKGAIPDEAFSGGSDFSGIPTYIGQTLFTEAGQNQILLPTIISKTELLPYVVVNNTVWKSSQYTKILCSTNNNLFRWIQVNKDTISQLTGCELISGGFDEEKIIIGRASVQGATITGRVYDSSEHFGLYIHDSRNKCQLLYSFEVLAFNCTKQLTL